MGTPGARGDTRFSSSPTFSTRPKQYCAPKRQIKEGQPCAAHRAQAQHQPLTTALRGRHYSHPGVQLHPVTASSTHRRQPFLSAAHRSNPQLKEPPTANRRSRASRYRALSTEEPRRNPASGRSWQGAGPGGRESRGRKPPPRIGALPCFGVSINPLLPTDAWTRKQEAGPERQELPDHTIFGPLESRPLCPSGFLGHGKPKAHLPQHSSSPRRCCQYRPAWLSTNQAASQSISQLLQPPGLLGVALDERDAGNEPQAQGPSTLLPTGLP